MKESVKTVSKWLPYWWEAVEVRRKEYNISIERFSANIGISRIYYYKLRSGTYPVPKKMRKRIKRMLERLNPNAPLSLIIDYVRIRFPTSEQVGATMISEKLLKIPFEGFEVMSHGWNNYEVCYSYGAIFLCTSSNEELGVLLEMKGQGCRQFELYLEYWGKTWYDFFSDVGLYDGVYKRIDLAINDHYGILDIGELSERCSNGECIGLNKKFSVCASGELKHEKATMGRTLYIGSRSSEIYFCIYEKDYEQYALLGIPIEEAVTKNRFEIRLSGERASEAINNLLFYSNDDDCIETVVFGIINNYVRFAVRDDSCRKNQWCNCIMWQHFIGCYRDKLKLTLEPIPFSERRSLNWLSHQCVPTLKGFIMRDVECGTQIIQDMINNAKPSMRIQKVLKLERELLETLECRTDKKGELVYGKV